MAANRRGKLVRRIRSLARTGRERMRGGLQYWQAAGGTRSSAKRVKRP